MRIRLMHVAIMILAIGITLVYAEDGRSKELRDNYHGGHYRLVPGEYDAKVGTTSAGKPEYVTHKTMFLLDTHTGKVWLFVVESDWFKGSRWGWIPAKGFREGVSVDKPEKRIPIEKQEKN